MKNRSITSRIFSLLICFTLLLTSLSLFSCGRIKDLDPYRTEFEALIEASLPVNEILFGEGLPVYGRDESPGELTYSVEKNAEFLAYFKAGQGKDFPERLYTDNEGKFRMYYWIYRDVDLSAAAGEEIRICKYTVTYYVPEGTDASGEPDYDMITESRYALYRDSAETAIPAGLVGHKFEDGDGDVLSTLSVGEEILYSLPTGGCYYGLTGYREPVFEYEYDENDNEFYDVVRLDGEYLTVASIKAAAEAVYSADYLSAVYSSLFDGIRTDFSDSSSTVLLARYIEEAGANGGPIYLRKSNVTDPLFTEQRTYDYDTMEIAKPYSADRVNVTVTAHGTYYSAETLSVENGPHTVSLSFVLENGTWRLDSPTY